LTCDETDVLFGCWGFRSVVVRPEICEDGVERVVCRSICTKVHCANLTQLSPDIRRFAESKKMGAQLCGSMVYQSIVGHCPDARPVCVRSLRAS
jgi:hypothetical protein